MVVSRVNMALISQGLTVFGQSTTCQTEKECQCSNERTNNALGRVDGQAWAGDFSWWECAKKFEETVRAGKLQ